MRTHRTDGNSPVRVVEPFRSTLLEKIIGALGLPYLAGCTVFVLIAGPPGLVAFHFLESGDIAGSVEAFFHGLTPPTPWRQAASLFLWTVLYFYILWMTRFIRSKVLDAENAAAPLLPGGKADYRRVFGGFSRTLPPVLIALGLVGFFWRSSVFDPLVSAGPAGVAANAVYSVLYYYSIATAVWAYFCALWGLHRIEILPLRLEPLHADNMMGTGVLGTLSLSVSLAYFGAVGVLMVVHILGPVFIQFTSVMTAAVLAGIVLFFLALNGVHGQLAGERKKSRAAVHRRPVTVFGRLWDVNPQEGKPDGESLERAVSDLREILFLQLADRKAASLGEWPFDTRILGKLTAVSLSVAAGLIINVIVKVVLKL